MAVFLPNSLFAACGVSPTGWLWADENFAYLNYTTGPNYVAVPPYPQPVPFSTVIGDAGNHFGGLTNLVFTASTPHIVRWYSWDNGNNGIFGTTYAVHTPSSSSCTVPGPCNTTTVRPDTANIVLNTNVNALGIQSSMYSNKRRETTIRHEMGHVVGMHHMNVCSNLMLRAYNDFMPDYLDFTQQSWIDANYP